MHIKNKKILILGSILLALIALICGLIIYHDTRIEGWGKFAHNAQKNFPFISSVNFSNPSSTKISIMFSLNQKIGTEQVYNVMQYIEPYLKSESVLKDFKKHYRNRDTTPFNVELFYVNKFEYFFRSQFYSRGAFHDWYKDNYEEYVIIFTVDRDYQIAPREIRRNGSIIRNFMK